MAGIGNCLPIVKSLTAEVHVNYSEIFSKSNIILFMICILTSLGIICFSLYKIIQLIMKTIVEVARIIKSSSADAPFSKLITKIKKLKKR